VAAIAILGLRAYSARQVMAWAAGHLGPPLFLEQAEPGDVVLVSLSPEGEPAAYTMLRTSGLVHMLYCHPDHAGQGHATALLAAIEREALAAGVERLHTKASEISLPVFERAGYAVLRRRDFRLELDGETIPMHNYAMEKQIA
jgi:putative acetyltransferase